MKKVGIITITNGNNYGNRLQNYGLQKYIQNNYICNVETFINNSNTLQGIVKKISFGKEKIKKEEKNVHQKKRVLNFNTFNNEYIKFSNIKIGNYKKNKKLKDFHLLICGSDQIWNSSYKENDRANFGYFYKNQNVISYSASFGINDVKKSKQNKYKKYLDNLKYISVRENIGKKIVNKLTTREDVEVLIDPTLLLGTDEWDEISKKPKQLNEIKKNKYILNYFLGNISNERQKEIEKIAEKYDCEIINLMNKESEFYECGPSEFLYLEKNAFLICTDSFHSCVFALIYNRPFVVFDREQNGIQSMNSRIDTLIEKFKLENRKYNGKKITEENIRHNYDKAYEILEKERKKSKKFLDKAFN